LSGGQRQSVALARTLIMDTPVLVLDEPTNAMDSGSEDFVLRNLEQFIRDKTFILVTHKPALLKLVNRLVVMEGGRVVMDGPRDAVLQALASGKVVVPKAAEGRPCSRKILNSCPSLKPPTTCGPARRRRFFSGRLPGCSSGWSSGRRFPK